ncbi:hypothetical protein CSB45_11030 [candidate division KSB3 bacterium]|uniref:Uncharacterized protein n=1 Tax=candidate division KSB3 bacterium TaxID=2044937 RepID=A0A2G6E3Q6_9BACT|nr:MAG: hypothetical protein CSB45_11030 [candidate division KSB3 bacterium]PIE29056.1 MAG: hypothetical protein CSA57_10575 [candidate division KSB3 bacterium]
MTASVKKSNIFLCEEFTRQQETRKSHSEWLFRSFCLTAVETLSIFLRKISSEPFEAVRRPRQ